MGNTYDMANGRFESSPAQDITATERDEIAPTLEMHRREPSPAGIDSQSHSHAIHLIRALLGKG